MALQLPGVKNIFPHSKSYNQGIQQKPLNVGTRELFIIGTDPGPTVGLVGAFLCWQIGPTGGDGNVTFKCPNDFGQIESAELIYFPDENITNADINIDSNMATEGEAYNTHTESDNVSTYTATANQVSVIDVSGILTNMQADDYVGIHIDNQHATMTMKLLGLRLRYT